MWNWTDFFCINITMTTCHIEMYHLLLGRYIVLFLSVRHTVCMCISYEILNENFYKKTLHVFLLPYEVCISLRQVWGAVNSWSGLYGGWIYNYSCNQFLSPLKLWVRTPFVERCTRYNIMWYSLSVTCDRSVVFSGYSGFLHQSNWPPCDKSEILLTVELNTINQTRQVDWIILKWVIAVLKTLHAYLLKYYLIYSHIVLGV